MTKRIDDNRAVEIRIHGASKAIGGLSTAQELAYRIAAPNAFTAKEVGIAQRDFEILSAMLRDSPGKVQDMVAALLDGNHSRARTIARALDLEEAKFIARGGGLPMAVIVIAVACALLLASDNPQ